MPQVTPNRWKRLPALVRRAAAAAVAVAVVVAALMLLLVADLSSWYRFNDCGKNNSNHNNN
jgi:hypothetical protein